MRIRKIIAFLLSASVACTAFPAFSFAESVVEKTVSTAVKTQSMAGVEAQDSKEGEDRKLTSVKKAFVPIYFGDIDSTYDIPVYFVNGVSDIPYMDLSDWIDVMVTLYQLGGYTDYGMTMEPDDYVVFLTRENGYTMMIDFQDQTITFQDYDAFTHVPGDTSLLDMVTSDSYDEDGNPILFERIEKGSFDRYGKEIELDLASYDIPIYWSEEDGLYLVPLQTLGDFLLSGSYGLSTFFNQEGIYLSNSDCFGLFDDDLTQLGYSYYSAPYGDMSKELAWFSYCELCLALDHLYGQKEIHDIKSFDQIFQETAYRQDLCSTDPNVKDGALNDFIYYYLDDLHSGFICESYRTQEMDTDGGDGLSSQQDTIVGKIYGEAREGAENEILSYEEVGNTAYITFDSFSMLKDEPSDYYEEDIEVDADPASDTLDTVSLILYAHDEINREDSPIENVVIDLSLNGGGAIDAAAFVCAWYLGEASLSIRSSLTGAVSTGKYRADTNLDGVYDEQDMLSGKKLFCLISPYSFSCGNLVPNVFKSSNRVTLLGKESGGGSCSILSMSTAYGSIFQISSPNRMSYLKNGSYYDTDTGIEPDCFITKPENFYDRVALTEYINELF